MKFATQDTTFPDFRGSPKFYWERYYMHISHKLAPGWHKSKLAETTVKVRKVAWTRCRQVGQSVDDEDFDNCIDTCNMWLRCLQCIIVIERWIQHFLTSGVFHYFLERYIAHDWDSYTLAKKSQNSDVSKAAETSEFCAFLASVYKSQSCRNNLATQDCSKDIYHISYGAGYLPHFLDLEQGVPWLLACHVGCD